MKPLSFTDRMAQGRDLAQVMRNRGQPTGAHKSWHKSTRDRAPLSLDDLESYFHQWRKDQSYNAYLAVEAALFPDPVEF